MSPFAARASSTAAATTWAAYTLGVESIGTSLAVRNDSARFGHDGLVDVPPILNVAEGMAFKGVRL